MFVNFFIDRPIFASVLAIVIVVAGAVAIPFLPIAMFPEITPPQVVVTATYPGASAEVVEQTVATPIEQQVNGVEDMIYMSSRSGSDGTHDAHRDVQGRHRPRHRRRERAEPGLHRPGQAPGGRHPTGAHARKQVPTWSRSSP